MLDDLWKAMSSLYDARSKSQGPPFDKETFQEIAGLQDQLQKLLTRLEKVHGKDS